jgi:hypothetical protein
LLTKLVGAAVTQKPESQHRDASNSLQRVDIVQDPTHIDDIQVFGRLIQQQDINSFQHGLSEWLQ